MRPAPTPALLRALRLLLPLAACSWGPAVSQPMWSSSGDLVHLYTSNDWRHYHLQIHPDGRVDGSASQTVNSALIMKAVGIGNVAIYGVNSELFLCMDRNGNLKGKSAFNREDCAFRHVILENGYDVYQSRTHRYIIGLGRSKTLYTNRNPPALSQFLTRSNEIPLVQFRTPRTRPSNDEDVPDPCGGILTGRINPGGVAPASCLPFPSLEE